jgi:hypothetical protein
VFENRVLRNIFGPRREKVAGYWRRLHDEELHNFYASPNIFREIKSRSMKWTELVARMGEVRSVYEFLFGKPERNTALGRLKCRCVDNIRMDLKKFGLEMGGLDASGPG